MTPKQIELLLSLARTLATPELLDLADEVEQEERESEAAFSEADFQGAIKEALRG